METTLIDPVRTDIQVSEPTFASRVAFRFCVIYFGAYCLTTQILTSLVPVPNFNIPDPSTFWPLRPIITLDRSSHFSSKAAVGLYGERQR